MYAFSVQNTDHIDGSNPNITVALNEVVSTCPVKGAGRTSNASTSNGNRQRPNTNQSNRGNNSNNNNNNYRNRNRNYGYDDSMLDERNTEQNFVDNNHLNDDGESSIVIDSDDGSFDSAARSKVSRSSSTSSASIIESSRIDAVIFGQFLVISIISLFAQRY